MLLSWLECDSCLAKVELGLHRVGEPAHVLPALRVRQLRDIISVKPVVRVLVRHHGRPTQLRDATYMGVVARR